MSISTFWGVGQGYLRDSKHYRRLLLPFVATRRGGKLSSYCWRHHALQTQDPTAHELDLTWKPFPQGLAFKAPKGTMQASKGGSSQQACSAMVPMDHSNSGMHPVVATNSSLTGLRACWARGGISPTTLGCWSHGSWKAYSYHFTRTDSPELHWNISYLQINVVLTPYQRNFSWQHM